jgi:galactoside O-acetyltransferase
MAFLDADALRGIGLASIGTGVRIDEDARLIGARRIHIGSNVRIDAFALLSAGDGGIRIGDHVHVAAHCFVAGEAAIELDDFCGISCRVSVYSSTDDFSGESLTGPTVPAELRRVDSRPVRVGRHVIVGTGAVILPAVTIHDGSAVGALSLVRHDVAPGIVVAGMPAKPIGTRSAAVLALEKRLAMSP